MTHKTQRTCTLTAYKLLKNQWNKEICETALCKFRFLYLKGVCKKGQWYNIGQAPARTRRTCVYFEKIFVISSALQVRQAVSNFKSAVVLPRSRTYFCQARKRHFARQSSREGGEWWGPKRHYSYLEKLNMTSIQLLRLAKQTEWLKGRGKKKRIQVVKRRGNRLPLDNWRSLSRERNPKISTWLALMVIKCYGVF